MKTLILLLAVFLMAGSVQAQQLEQYFIPLATTINSNTPRHLLQDSETPNAQNCRLDNGKIKASHGITDVMNFNQVRCENLVDNGDFSRDTDGWSVVDNGTVTAESNGYFGKCAKFTVTSVSPVPLLRNDTSITLTKGKRYRLSGYIKGSAGLDARIRLINATNETTRIVCQQITTGVSDWIKYDVYFDCSLRGDYYFDVFISAPAAGDYLYIDELKVEHVTAKATTGIEIVKNGGFSSDTTNWTASSGATIASVEGGVAGSNCLQIKNESGTTAYCNVYQQLTGLATNRYYKVSAYFKEGTQSGLLYGLCMSDNTTLSGKYYADYGVDDSSDFNEYSFVFKADGTTRYLVLSFYLENDNTMLVDIVSVKEIPHDFTAVSECEETFNYYDIISFYKANDNYALIATGDKKTWGTGKILEWNLDVSAPVITELTTTHCTTQTWRFVNHYDQAMGTVTVLTNGVDDIKVYKHDEREIDNLIPWGESQTNGKYLASYYDALYLAYITKLDDEDTVDPYAIVWSEIGDISDFNVTEYYQRRPEDGLPITMLKTHNDMLILGKGGATRNNQIWQIAPYSNFTRLSDKIGPTSSEGSTSADTLVFNDKARIMTMEGDWLSQPINEMISGALSGGADSIYMEYNPYSREILTAVSNNIFIYNMFLKKWEAMKYARRTKAVAALPAGRKWREWTGDWKKHSAMTFLEEDAIPDTIIISANSILSTSNHFTDENEVAMSSRYETKTVSCGDPSIYKRFQQIRLYGKYIPYNYYETDTKNTYTVYGSFFQSPARPKFEKLGTVTLNSQGYGDLWIDKRGIWLALAVEVSSRNYWELENIAIKYVPQTQR